MNASDAAFREEFPPLAVRRVLADVFAGCAEEALDALAAAGEWVELNKGEALFAQGDLPDSLFVLLRGLLKAAQRTDGGEMRAVGKILRHESVGEADVLADAPRASTVTALRDSLLLRLPRDRYEALAACHPQIVASLARVALRFLRAAGTVRDHRPGLVRVGLVSLNESADQGLFLKKLATALTRTERVMVLRSDTVDGLTGRPGLAAAAPTDPAAARHLAGWLDAQEDAADICVLVADEEATPWTRRCVGAADTLLVLTDAGADPTKTGLMEQALRTEGERWAAASKSLVLLQRDDAARPTGTARWFGPGREWDMHHHVRLGRADDFARVARFLTGNAVGLVLGAGGARGLAHVGVFLALREAGVEIDFVGGTSIGALVGAVIVSGYDGDDLLRKSRAMAMARPTSDFTPAPFVALLKGVRVEAQLDELLGPTDIEDTWIPFFCVSGNYTRAMPAVHQSGRMSRAVRASLSLPGIFPPTVSGGDLHVDGAIFNQLPVDVMRRFPVGPVVAVDLTHERTFELNYDRVPGPRALLWDRLMRRRRWKVPGLLSVITRSTLLSSDHHARAARKLADVCLNPNVTRFGLLDWQSHDRIVAAGRESAREDLAKDPSLLERLRPRRRAAEHHFQTVNL